MADKPMDEKEVFNAARHIAGPAERLAYLQEACGPDAAAQGRILKLLRVHDQERSFLETSPVARCATLDEPPTEGVGTIIGPYKLLEQIGEGGFGVVFMAEQLQPVRRKAALKLIKPGMDTKQVVARFEAERQALALMDHPNIARVFDAGATASGRPYFVMELVRGVPITQFCDANRLIPRQRLELFVSVCQAIQHAHQKGIIHRDVKPSNVLVTLHNGTPVIKVIDFGIAKAVGPPLTDMTLFTGFAQLIGTPMYMSPEQAEMSGLDVDTRSDVYSLGVLLYELLTGTTPFDGERLRTVGYDEMRRIIREEEPARPSTRVSTLGAAAATVSANRRCDPKRLSRLFRGELDWVVMKALEKDRDRRYESASGLARDVEGYLRDEPVQACPPSAGYRLMKFARRNKGPVLAVSLVVLALVGGIIGTTVGLVRTELAWQAEAQRAEGERRAKETAEKRLAQVEKGIDVLGLVFENLDPMAEEQEGRPLRAILGDALDQAAAQLDGEAVGDPLVVAKLQDRLGRTYMNLGHAAKAETLFTKVVATRRADLGADHPLTLVSRRNQAVAQLHAGKATEAIALLEQVRSAQVQTLGPDDPDTLVTLSQLAVAYLLAGDPRKAVALLEQVRDVQVGQLGNSHLDTLLTLDHLAAAYQAARRPADAIALLEQVYNTRRKEQGEDHPKTLISMGSLALKYTSSGQLPQAIDWLEKVRDVTVLKLGADHLATLGVQGNLCRLYRAAGRINDAIVLGERVREGHQMILGGRHPSTLTALDNLASAYLDAEEPVKALALFQQAAAGVEKLEFVHPFAGPILLNLCECHERLKQYDQAEVWRRKLLAVVKERVPASTDNARVLTGLGSNLLKQSKHAEAESVLRESLTILQKSPPRNEITYFTQSLLGAALLDQQKYAAAEPLLVAGYQGMKKSETEQGLKHAGSSTKARLTEAVERLVQLYDAWVKPEEAARWRKELEALQNPTGKSPSP